MKKKIFLSTIILIFIITQFCNVNVATNTKTTNANTTSVNISNVKQETGYLEDYLHDEQEQKITEELDNKVELKDQINEITTKNEINTIATQSNPDYYIPYSFDFISEAGSKDGYHWYVSSFSLLGSDIQILKHDITNNTNKIVYKMDKQEKECGLAYYYNNDTIYIMYVKGYESDVQSLFTPKETTYVIGISTKSEQVVYEGSFNVPQICGEYLQSFAVDSKQRFYIGYEQTGIKVFDKNGSLIYDIPPFENEGNRDYIYIKGISPNDKALFFEWKHKIYDDYGYFQSVYEGQQKINDNGTFVKNKYTVYGRSYDMGLYSYCPNWKFLDDEGIYAADQYGRIAKFNYDDPITEDSPIGVDREFIFDVRSDVVDYNYDPEPYTPNVCVDGDYVYIMGSNCNIYKVNYKTLQCDGYISTGIKDYRYTDGLTYFNNCLYLKVSSSEGVMKKFTLDSSAITPIKNIVYTNADSKSGSRSTDDIIEKYNSTRPTFNYNDSIYKENPSWVNNYVAGSLKQGVITDTLNMLNYYRWLVGVDEIPLNENKMERSQKGAVLMRANEKMSHYPEKPNDMDDNFFQEAYDGCNAKYKQGDTYSGNVGVGDRTPYEAIQNYVNDLNNITINSATGHRQSMLDPKATGVSFGYCDKYSAVSIYYDDIKDVTDAKFYSFPSAGNFPNEEMKVGEWWSIYMTGKISGTVSAKFTYKGKEYQGNVNFESGYPVLNIKMPDELITLLGGADKNIPSGTSIGVEVYGIKDENLDNVSYKYTVDFFSTKPRMKGDTNYDGKVTLYDALQILKQAILKGDLSDDDLYIMDFNNDNKVTLYDALKFLQQAIIG